MWLPATASEDAVFVLHADQIISVEIQKLGCPLVRSLVFLGKLQSYTLRIVVGRVRIVDWNGEEPRVTVFSRYGGTQIRGERGDAALPRQIVANEGDASWQRQWLSRDFAGEGA